MLRGKRNFRLIVRAVVIVGAVTAVVALTRTTKGYESLEELITQICWAIEDRDENTLKELCHVPTSVPFELIFQQNENLNYVKLLHEGQGWKYAYSWTLGGHDLRFGRIHFDFVKQLDNKWYLRCIKQYR